MGSCCNREDISLRGVDVISSKESDSSVDSLEIPEEEEEEGSSSPWTMG